MMKLRHSGTSPFARKVVVTAIETGQDSEIELVKTDTANPELGQVNPLGKIPALILDDGAVLIDSAIICEYLDSRKSGGLIPAGGAARWAVLSRTALADGIMDAAILRRYEVLRPETLRSVEWDQRQKTKMEQGLGALERDVAGFGGTVDMSTLTVAIMLDYLDFRYAPEAWRDRHPKLAAWHKGFSARPSLQSTLPKG